MKNCGLIGRNIHYSRSPEIHNKYYKDNGIQFNYKIFNIDNEKELEYFMRSVENNNIIGFNVTIPYKEKILQYLDEIVYPASIIGAVNTILVDDKKFIGYNTDYYGFIDSLKEHQIQNIDKKHILILGNGGSAKAVYTALIDLGVKYIDVAGRNLKNIEQDFLYAKNILSIKSRIHLHQYDMLINCTPLGNTNNNILPIELENYKEGLVIYDLNYSPSKSKLLCLGESKGLKVVNGEAMLIAQAIHSIDIWKSKVKG